MSKIILHVHLSDRCSNPSTLICRLGDSGISYTYYQGHGSSGMGYALSNIQFYTYENGRMKWQRNASLPIENLPNEKLSEFKQRVLDMLNKSTEHIVKVVNTEVSFAPE